MIITMVCMTANNKKIGLHIYRLQYPGGQNILTQAVHVFKSKR